MCLASMVHVGIKATQITFGDELAFHRRGLCVPGSAHVTLLILSKWKILSAKGVDPDQTPHYVASDLGLHFCL